LPEQKNLLHWSIDGRESASSGTSHFLGQNFAKAFDVKFANAEGKQEYVWELRGVFRRVWWEHWWWRIQMIKD
jgi:hypothetical protein